MKIVFFIVNLYFPCTFGLAVISYRLYSVYSLDPEEKSEMYQQIRGKDGLLWFPIGPKTNTSWVAVVIPTDRPKSVRNRCVIELFCCFVCVFTLPFLHCCWCRGFFHRTESDLFFFSLGRGLSSCQVSSNSIQQFQRKSRKILRKSDSRTPIFFFDWPENKTLTEGAKYLVSVNFR